MEQLSKTTHKTFQELANQLELSSGNLYSHCQVLERENYITKSKQMINGNFLVTYAITPLGLREFSSYIESLTNYLENLKSNLLASDKDAHLPPSLFCEGLDPESNRFALGLFE